MWHPCPKLTNCVIVNVAPILNIDKKCRLGRCLEWELPGLGNGNGKGLLVNTPKYGYYKSRKPSPIFLISEYRRLPISRWRAYIRSLCSSLLR